MESRASCSTALRRSSSWHQRRPVSPSRPGEIVTRDQTFRANNGATFAVESGFDYHGDHKTVNANNLHDCINICSTQAACLAVSYRCYRQVVPAQVHRKCRHRQKQSERCGSPALCVGADFVPDRWSELDQEGLYLSNLQKPYAS